MNAASCKGVLMNATEKSPGTALDSKIVLIQRRIRTTTSPGTPENAVSQSVSRNCLTTNRDLTPCPCVCDTIVSTKSSFLREHLCGEFFQTLPNLSSVGVLSACLRVLVLWVAPGHHLPHNKPLAHPPLAHRMSRRQSPSRCRRYVLLCMAVHLPLQRRLRKQSRH